MWEHVRSIPCLPCFGVQPSRVPFCFLQDLREGHGLASCLYANQQPTLWCPGSPVAQPLLEMEPGGQLVTTLHQGSSKQR